MPIGPDQKAAMHKLFLATVRQDISHLEEQLQELRAVERYHASIVTDEGLATIGSQQSSTVSDTEPPSDRVDPRLGKRDAIKLALSALGGSATTVQICQWLRGQGYGAGIKPNIFYNGVFTTLKRGAMSFCRDEKSKKWSLMDAAARREVLQ